MLNGFLCFLAFRDIVLEWQSIGRQAGWSVSNLCFAILRGVFKFKRLTAKSSKMKGLF